MSLRLWLDDERQPPVGWIWVRSVDQAKIAIENNHFLGIAWQALSLDHDLGSFGGPGKEGHDFLAWMCETNNWPREKPLVHTSNPYESRMMRLVIDRFFPGGQWN